MNSKIRMPSSGSYKQANKNAPKKSAAKLKLGSAHDQKTLSMDQIFGEALRLLESSDVDSAVNYLRITAKEQSDLSMPFSDRLVLLCSLIQQKNPKTALEITLIALQESPDNMSACLLAGSLQDRLGERKASAESMRKVIASAHAKPEQVLRAANLLVRFGYQLEALNSAKTAYETLGRPIRLASTLLYIAKVTADWECAKGLIKQIQQAYDQGQWDEVNESPRTHLLWCGDEKTNIEVIKRWSERVIKIPKNVIRVVPEPVEGRRIRVGYLSSDFRDHPTSRLIIGLLKNHDRSKFELFMYCSGWDDKSAMRREIESHFEHIHAVAHLTDEAAAQLIRSHRIDVLVELNGPTRAHRMVILAHRPAPVQIDYLGWPGSVGGRIVDYIVGDAYTVPQEFEALYPEKVIKLSKTYQVNDFASRTLPAKSSRSAVGLPEGDQLILGMFNAINKVDATVWGTWMRIMQAVPHSLMWLLDPGPVARKLIAEETAKQGIDVKRIVIAPRMKQDAHLARMQCCDLMLDPWPYGGHTSTSDALFSGVPVIALQGTNFASRVSGGLLHAAGMGVMVQPDIDSYVNMAVELLNKPNILAQAKKFLKEKVPKSDLFNAKSKALQIEKYYINAVNFFEFMPQEKNSIFNQDAILQNENFDSKTRDGSFIGNVAKPSIHVFIISWTGRHENATKIYNEVESVSDHVTIVYSDKNDNKVLPKKINQIKTDNNLYWSDKFQKCIETCSSEILLIIHGDCLAKDWSVIVERCINAYMDNDNLGLWAPLTHGTPFSLDITSIYENDKNSNVVAYLDGIVFALNKKIVHRMRLLDYSKNIYGWGIDWFAATYTYSEGMKALVDKKVIVNHPPERGYKSDLALQQMKFLMDQMTKKEKIYYNFIKSYIRYSRISHSGKISNQIKR